MMLWAVGGVGAAGLLVLVGWVVWRVPQALYAYVPEPKDRATAEASTRTGMIAGLAGLAALGSLALTTRTYRLTQQGQLTDRYTKAIDQLGDEKLDVRLGGIYALERIAVDSKRDHPTVVEVLSAYVRERSAPIRMVRPANRRTAHPPTLRKHVKLDFDVQAALTVLGRLPARVGIRRGNLSQVDLTGANLLGANLSRADLTRANLAGAKLLVANLARADLRDANLTEADLNGADLTEALLIEADLTKAKLITAKLIKSQINWANLSKADLTMANMTEALLTQADLTKANLNGADLTGARGLVQQQIDTALGNGFTQLPTGLRRPEGWPPRIPD